MTLFSALILRGRGLLALAVVCSFAILGPACIDTTPRVTEGKDFPEQRLVAIRRQKSTVKDVVELLGEPYEKKTFSERKQRWRYYYRRETKTAVFDLFEGPTQVRECNVNIEFDGALVDHVTQKTDNFED